MNNFEFCCRTRVVFGKGTIAKLPELISKDKKILLTYGQGSIFKNGVYEQVKKALEGYNIYEFGGIDPNPVYEVLLNAVKIVRDENIDFILAVGGGSTLDGSKFIAAAAKYDGECSYDLVSKGAEIKDAVELGAVITLPATGSEMNGNFVISRYETNEKFPGSGELVMPKFSIIDPETTYSLPLRQTVNGIVDTFVHVMEQYCTYDVNTPLQDEWALSLLKVLVREGSKVIRNPYDYDARANVFWCATCGLNNWLSVGCVQDWATHAIGHEITAIYHLQHGETLAVILPALLQNRFEDKKEKLAKVARTVFGYEQKDDKKAANYAIIAIANFFTYIGAKIKFSSFGLKRDDIAEAVSQRFRERGTVLGERQNITPDEVADIIRHC